MCYTNRCHIVHWSETTLNYRIMLERYPSLKEKVGDSIPGCKISPLLDKNLRGSLLPLVPEAGLSTFCLKKNIKGHNVYNILSVIIVTCVDIEYHICN